MIECSQILGEIIRGARISRGITQAQLAEMINADSRTILNIENNKGNPKFETLYLLIRFLEIDPRDIFFPELKTTNQSRRKLEILLKDRSEYEIQCLIPICKAVINTLNDTNSQPAIE